MDNQLGLRLPRSTDLSAASVVPLLLELAYLDDTVGWVINHLYTNIVDVHCVYVMKSGRLNLRLSDRRIAKLKAYANHKDKTITQLVEEWIDRLPLPEGMETSVPPVSRSSSPP